jgi:hypothetical protein
MKLLGLVASILLFSGCGVAWAQNKNQVDEAGLQFWTKFKTAVAKNDKEAVASMTRLPFLFQSRELTKTAFIQKFDAIFDARVKRCFVKAALVKEGDGFEVFCAKQIFLFEKVGGVYKFTEIGVDD